MGVKQYKPTSPGRRFQMVSDFAEITTNKPEKSLIAPLHKKAGRNNNGRITDAPSGRRNKRRYRRDRLQAQQGRRAGQGRDDRVRPEPHGPHRASPLRRWREALHPSPEGPACRRRRGPSGPEADIKPGNALPLADIPVGTLVHAVELQPGKGAALARSAGTSIQLMGKEGKYAILRMPSSEMRRVLLTCRATIGEVGNAEHCQHQDRQGRPQPLAGIRPDGPRHGHEPGRPPARRRRGQEPHLFGRPPVTPVGQADQGPSSTRNPKKPSSKLIIRRRKK
jgi:large subunit ribosomal protein L2